jgi:putative drug exporter of the RND superfamily
MHRRTWTESLARACARRRWLTVSIWAVALVLAVFAIVNWLGDAMVTDATFTNKPESMVAYNMMTDRIGTDRDELDEMIIVRSKTLTVDDPAFAAQVNGLYGEVMALGSDVAYGGVTYYMVQDPSMVSADRHATMIPFKMTTDSYKRMTDVYALGDKYTTADFEIFHTGNAGMMEDMMTMSENDMKTGETVGIGVALIVLALVFGAIVAAFLPILMAIGAIVVALGLTALVGQAMDLTFMVTNMITMMGLAVGIDYSLFILTRFREERAKGLGKIDAIGMAGSTANKAVFFSGITVLLALCGLVMFPLSIFISMGIGSLLVVFASIVASMTLLPALISIFGDKVNSWRIPFIQRPQKAQHTNGTAKGFWAWVTRTVTRAPAISLILTVAILGAAIIPFFDKKSGMSGITSVPDYLPSKQGYLVLLNDFHMGLDSPTMVVIDGDITTPETQSAVTGLQEKITNDPIYSSAVVAPYPDKNMAVIYARVAGDTMSIEAKNSVTKIREQYIPATFSATTAKAMVTGESAFMVDYDQITNDYTPIIFTFVLGLSFIVLLLAFRSIVIPVTAIFMNLLSVGASYGLIVLVFQKGIGAGILGFTRVATIETWLPLFLFAVLFGLSMDYQVFLLSRVREHYMQHGDNTEAVGFGLRSTGRLITGAALIMVAVFGGFALGDMVMMQQMGFGLAIAVLIDSTLVRCVLVPATMKLLGKANWYLPKWLNWLPNISIGEGGNHETTATPAQPSFSKQQINPITVAVENSDEPLPPLGGNSNGGWQAR